MAQTEQNRPASELNCFEHAFIYNFLPVGKKKGRRTQSLYNTFFQNVPPARLYASKRGWCYNAVKAWGTLEAAGSARVLRGHLFTTSNNPQSWNSIPATNEF